MPTRATDHDHLRDAAQRLREGGAVAFPTETVFGVGVDLLNIEAAKRLFLLKRRPLSSPLTANVADEAMARQLTAMWTDRAADLASRFWPGPLTIIAPRSPMAPDVVVAGGQTIGLRCPDHPVAQALLRSFGSPIAATSANLSGDLPPLTADEVRATFKGDDVFTLDGEPTPGGLESTVLALSTRQGEPDRIIRRGPIGPGDLGSDVVTDVAAPASSADCDEPPAPVTLFNDADWPAPVKSARGAVVVLSIAHRQLNEPHIRIDMPTEPGAYAQRLYEEMRRAHSLQPAMIAIERPNNAGDVWDAIRDRLDKLARHGR